MKSYSSNSAAPSCSTANFLENVWEFTIRGFCQSTPTSVANYKITVVNNTAVRFTVFPPSDTNCTGASSSVQVVGQNACFKLNGDNPVISYQLAIVDANCGSNNGCPSGTTCCYTPNGNACAQAPNACCCPDFQNACPSGSSCACNGVCPGPGCQCSQCLPAGFGLCL